MRGFFFFLRKSDEIIKKLLTNQKIYAIVILPRIGRVFFMRLFSIPAALWRYVSREAEMPRNAPFLQRQRVSDGKLFRYGRCRHES